MLMYSSLSKSFTSMLLVGWTCVLFPAAAADLQIVSMTPTGRLDVTNSFSNGVVTVERADSVDGPWVAEKSIVSVGSQVSFDLTPGRAVSFFRAKAVDLSSDIAPWPLETGDILDLPTLAARLASPPDQDGVSQYLGTRLAASTSSLLSGYGGGIDPALRQALTDDLNRVLASELLYDPDRYASVALSIPTLSLLAGLPQGEALIHLNRLLLEDAYPTELRQKRSAGFTNFVHSFGLLSTIAGSGVIACTSCNSWNSEAEGGPATNASLSSPHIAMADRAGNIYVADKRAHAIRKITPDGTISTVAGTGEGARGDTNPSLARSTPLNNPNGLWVLPDGTFYILDRDNGLIRRVDTHGIMTTPVDNGSPIPGGRGLWVSSDESILYFSAGSAIKSWDVTNGLSLYATGFSDLANIAMDPAGNLVVTDAGRNQVVRIETDGSQTVIAGGIGAGLGQGGDGQLATQTVLQQVRGIWFLATGGYFLCTDVASQVWYVDPEGHIHLLLDGDAAGAHAGDGAWFYQDLSTHKVSNSRQITLDYDGNLLITESNFGYVRKIRFLPTSVP